MLPADPGCSLLRVRSSVGLAVAHLNGVPNICASRILYTQLHTQSHAHTRTYCHHACSQRGWLRIQLVSSACHRAFIGQALVARSRSAGTVEILCAVPPAWERVCSTTPHWELTGLEQMNTSARMFAACTQAPDSPPDPLRGMLLAGHCVEPSHAAGRSSAQASASSVPLNAEQHAMVAEMCGGGGRPACDGLHVLWGPPGTGKTTTLHQTTTS